MPTADPLSHKEIEDQLAELPGWQAAPDDSRITRTYHLAHLPAAIFAVHIARIQDELQHHSDLTLGYDTLAVSISTHEAGGRVTAKDFELAHRIDRIAPEHGAR